MQELARNVLVMRKTSLNDLVYSFEPLKIVTPDPDHKVDEAELQKSIQKSKEMLAVIEEVFAESMM